VSLIAPCTSWEGLSADLVSKTNLYLIGKDRYCTFDENNNEEALEADGFNVNVYPCATSMGGAEWFI